MKKKKKIPNSIFMVLAGLFCVILVFGVMFFNYIRQFERTFQEENRTRLSEVSTYIAGYMEKMFSERQDHLKILAAAVGKIEDEEAMFEYLDQMSEELEFEYIGIAGEDGQLRASVFPEPQDISEEDYFQASMAGKPYLSDIVRQIFYDRAVGGVIMSVPVPGDKPRMIAAMISTTELGEDVQVDSFGQEGYSYVINDRGELVLHARSMEYSNLFQTMRNMEFLPGYSWSGFVEDIGNHREGMTEYLDFEVQKYAYYRPMKVNGWTVVSTVPTGVITERTAGLTRKLAVLCALSVLIFLMLLTIVYNMFLRMESRKRENIAKSAFLANMSHDMRTPMNAIIGMTEIAGAHADEPDTVRDCLKKIKLSSGHLLGLINDILDMAKIENGKIELSQEEFTLPAVFDSTVNIIYPLIRAKKQKFSIRLHHITHENLYGDELRVSQIFINILTNAVKFTPEGNAIAVDVEELDRGEEDTAWFRFTFSDRGIGMKEEFLGQIFSAFTRVKDSRVDKIEGSGLGMAITKNLIDAMNGRIEVTSEEGEGTVFDVTIPFKTARETGRQSSQYGSLLLVGGEEGQGNETVDILEKLGVNACWAADAGQAAALPRGRGEAAFDAVLIDREIMNDGTLDVVCQAFGGRSVLVLTAYDWDDIRAEAAAMGITQFLKKPLFRSVLQRFLDASDDNNEEFTKVREFDFRTRRFLLAEDNEMNLEIIRNILIDTGAEADGTEDGGACVKKFEESPEGYYDMVLMDIQMPVMNGYEAARQIRSMARPDSGLPILAMSANAYAEDVSMAKKSGMTGYLTKPIEMQVWLEEISRGLEGR